MRISILAPGLALLVAFTAIAGAGSDPSAVALMQAVSARADSGRQQAHLRFTLTPKSGTAQIREATAYRSVEPQARRLAICFEFPAAIRGSSFLAWDAREPDAADDQWLYLPALRRARRIPGRDRGSYFLGTDLTYYDIRSFGRIEVTEYQLGAIRPLPDDKTVVEVEGEPENAALKQELGYGRVRWRVDPDRALIHRSEHWDVQGVLLKTIEYRDLQLLDGIWVARTIAVENHKTGHRTELTFSDMNNRPDFDSARLTPAGLERGG